MLSNYLSITSIIFKNTFRRNDTDKKKVLLIILAVIGGFMPIAIMMGVLIYQITPQMIELNVFKEMIVAIIGTTQLVVLVFGLFSLIAYMFFSEDAEFLSSLPVKKSSLFLSKLTMVYFNELLISFAILVPMLIVMGVSAINYGLAINWYYFALIPISVLFTPLIPLLLASLLAFPMMYIVSFFKRRAILSSMVLIFFFIAIMMFYLGTIGNASGDAESIVIGENIANMLIRLSKITFFNTLYASAMVGNRVLLNLFLYLVIVAVSMVLSVSISSLLYHKSVMAQLETPQGKVSRGHIDEQKEKSRAYMIKDFKMLIRNPSFAFQSFMGVLLTPIMIFFFAKSFGSVMEVDPNDIEGAMVQFQSIASTGYVIFFVGMLLCGTNFVASVAFTREGKYFYFIKYLPISYKEVIQGKLNFANATGLVGVILTTIVYLITIDTNIINALLFGGVLTMMTYSFNYMGVYRDLRKPKLEWNNVQEAIKQNLNAMFPMLIGSIYGIAIFVISIIIENNLGDGFVPWLIIWLTAYIPLIGLFVYYKQQLDNNYVRLINKIE